MKKILFILLIIFSFFCFISCSNTSFDPEKDKELLREACEIIPPQNTKKEYERDIIRSHAGVISKYYTHESDCSVIKNHYEKLLRDRGWEKVPKTFFSYPDSIDFRKEDVYFDITCSETRDLWGIKRFSFSCSKGLD